MSNRDVERSRTTVTGASRHGKQLGRACVFARKALQAADVMMLFRLHQSVEPHEEGGILGTGPLATAVPDVFHPRRVVHTDGGNPWHWGCLGRTRNIARPPISTVNGFRRQDHCNRGRP